MKGLFLVPADYDSLVRKGVNHVIAERDEGGFLARVITVHPFALHNRECRISETGVVVEFAQPASSRIRILSWLRFAAHLIHVVVQTTRMVRHEKIDFVRAQDPFFCGLVGYFVVRLTGRPFCISLHADYEKMHELDPEGGAPRIFGSRQVTRKLEAWLLRRADRVLAISGYMARYAERHGAMPDRVRLFRHVVDLAAFAAEPSDARSAVSGDTPIIGVVSRLSAQKYIDDVVDIAGILRAKGVSFEMRIAGDGERRALLEQRIQKEDLNGCVLLLGFQDQAALSRLHAASAVHLSLICGASLIEASAAGACIVGYDVEWQSELVRSGKTGVLVPVGDKDAAAAAIIELLHDSERREAYGTRMQEAVRSMFDPQTLRAQRQRVYSELVEMGSIR